MSLKNIILIVALLGSLYIGYTTFFGGTEETLMEGDGTGTTEADVSADLVALLDKVKSIRMDGRIFTSASFQSLEDMTEQVENEPVGRNNPFAPVGTDGVFVGIGPAIQASTTGSQ